MRFNTRILAYNTEDAMQVQVLPLGGSVASRLSSTFTLIILMKKCYLEVAQKSS